jgi:hypothetical protein
MNKSNKFNITFETPTWNTLVWESGQCEVFQWHICGSMLGMAILSPSHTQDNGHQDCTRTAHGNPIIN